MAQVDRGVAADLLAPSHPPGSWSHWTTPQPTPRQRFPGSASRKHQVLPLRTYTSTRLGVASDATSVVPSDEIATVAPSPVCVVACEAVIVPVRTQR